MSHPNSLPTIRLFDTDYFVDNRLQQLRNAHDPHDFMEFNEFETMVQLATLSILHSGGANSHPKLTRQLYEQTKAFDKATGRTATTQDHDLFETINAPQPPKRKTRKLRM